MASADAPAPLVCRGYGGISDSLNQVWRCVTYAASEHGHGRAVHVLFPFFSKARLCDVLEPSAAFPPPVPLVLSTPEAVARLIDAHAVTVPAEAYKSNWMPATKSFQPTCDLALRYPRDALLAFNSDGNAGRAFDALRWLRLTPSAASRYEEVRARLPPAYAALHARHTDFKSDLATVRTKLAALLARHEHVVLFTDSAALQKECVAAFPTLLLSPIALRGSRDTPQHSSFGHVVADVLLEAFMDLCLCAAAVELLTSHATSGYSTTALKLHGAPDVLASFTRAAL